MLYRIGEFARLSGVSIKTLRFYAHLGLLAPAAVDARTRYRLYAPHQLKDLAAIRALKGLGASLDDIRLVVSRAAASQERHRLLDRLKQRAEHSLAATQRSLRWIDSALEAVDAGRAVPIVLKKGSAARVASIRARVDCYAQIDRLERDLRQSIERPLKGNLQGVLWHRCAASGAIEGEPFVEISRRTPHSGAFAVRELPSVTVASAYCEPDDRDAERVYDALSRWIHLHDYQLAGPKREIHLGQILEIQFPVV